MLPDDPAAIVKGIVKLGDYVASGIGSVAGPMLASWRARREAEAKQIAAKGEMEAQRILAEGRAHATRIEAAAQADARAILLPDQSTFQGELDIATTVSQRIQFQEEKRQRNIGAVVEKAALIIGDKEVTDKEPDHDWTARFFSDIQDVSSEEMQLIWAKVLAGEVERPGYTSIRTLSILRTLDQETAAIFRQLCSACTVLMPVDNMILDARAPSLGGNPGSNSLQKYGLGFGNLNVLNEHGLIISDYQSWYDYRMAAGMTVGQGQTQTVYIPFGFQGKYWILLSESNRNPNEEFRLSGVALTKSGQ